ncbi:MAG: hypothetical protein DIZ80_03985 [endosymbiont of Galathealinum brachiosum]|uniref:DUF4136 domain-containing protein n=1 Tax=endosymbiont of Galathealinum brachiosum TaxID=2200906 RepID=A0A370DI88_9GAMM|nr:MAG: hypothetical protein DIZ80_03985 [endosymbiont of Galathealinum brachiosum]
MKSIKMAMAIYAYLVCISLVTFNAQAEVTPELMRSSVVVVAQPEFSLTSLKSFSWADNHADISAGLQKSSFSVSALIDEAIVQAISKKAYPMEQGPKSSMMIQYHVSLASEMSDTALTLKYGLSPGLRGNSIEAKSREKGVLIVDLIDTQLNNVVWRGAVEVFTGIEDTDNGRQQRVNGLLVELFSSIPDLK